MNVVDWPLDKWVVTFGTVRRGLVQATLRFLLECDQIESVS